MTISGALILFASIWFLSLFISLQVGIKTQHEHGEIVPGTPASAPVEPNFKRRLLIVTLVTFVLWAALVAFLMSGWLTIADIDFFGRLDQSPR